MNHKVIYKIMYSIEYDNMFKYMIYNNFIFNLLIIRHKFVFKISNTRKGSIEAHP